MTSTKVRESGYGTFEKSRSPQRNDCFTLDNRRSRRELLLSTTFQTFKDRAEEGKF